jgi:hypothetical protein
VCSGAELTSRQSSLKIFTCQMETASPKASLLLNLYIAIFQRDNTKQTTSPDTQLLPLLLYLISLVLPSSSHPDLLFTNPNDPTCPPAKLPYKKYVSNYHMLHFSRSHGSHPTLLRFSSRALPLLSLHYHCHIPHNHLSFTQASTPTQSLIICSDKRVYAPRNCRYG